MDAINSCIHFLFFGANDIQNDQEKGGIAAADRPEGPFSDYLGRPLIDKYYNGVQPIDRMYFHENGLIKPVAITKEGVKPCIIF